MKDFFKYMLATVLGLVVAGILFLLLGVTSLAGMIGSSSVDTGIKDNSVLVLTLKGTVVERYQANPLDQLLGEELPTYGLDCILSAIDQARQDDRIKGIYLNPESFSCSIASLQSIRRALKEFKECGKFIIAYSGEYTQGGYYLASIADRVFVNPSGHIAWHGLSSQTVFLKEILDKVGVEMQTFRVGTYKSAVEPFISTRMSEANRIQMQALVGSIWNQLVEEVSAARNISADSLNLLADKNMDFQTADEYVKNKMADGQLYQDEVLDVLKTWTNTDVDSKLHTVSLDELGDAPALLPKDKSGNIIAVYYAHGEIDGGGPSYEGIHSEKVCNHLRKLREDRHVKAVVLRINSPGGSAYGSEQIWREVSLLKEKKPVIVSMGDYAASGGYYISCAAHWIVAEPGTVTGSIGIFGMVPNAEKLVREKLGIHVDGVKTNRLADMGNITRALTSEESGLMQQMVDKGYELFVKRCAEGRNIPLEDLNKIAEGRIWSGEMAKEIRLVDELGGLCRAVEVAREKAGIEKYTLVSYPARESFLTSLFYSGSERYIYGRLENRLGEWYAPFSVFNTLDKKDRMQARIPFMMTVQ